MPPPTVSTTSCGPPASRCSTTSATPAPGEKLTDAELLGCPLRIVVGRRGLAEGVVEASERALRRRAQAARGRGGQPGPRAPPGQRWLTPPPSAAAACAASSASTAAARRRARLRKGEPLNPWTLPNLVGYVRLAALPLFLWLAFESGDGRSAPAAIVFWLIAAGDYLDGFLARVTGQYSRLGSMLDPLVDRLTILSGAVVCWHFELLPRWALALLAAREVAMLLLAQYGLRHGVEIRVNWPGRISVFPIMGGIFFAMVFAGWVPAALLIIGLVLAIVATVLYARVNSRISGSPPPRKADFALFVVTDGRQRAKSALARARPSCRNLQPSVDPLADRLL